MAHRILTRLTGKKRIVIIIVLVAALLLAAVGGGVALFLHATKGEIYLRDGYYQNDRVYVRETVYRDGCVYATIVNDTPKEKNLRYAPFVERRVDGQWVTLYWERPLFEVRVRGIEPFDEVECVIPVRLGLEAEMVPGDYRFIYGALYYDYGTDYVEDVTKPLGLIHNTYYDPPVCIVGYFTITADMVGQAE